MIGLRLFLAQLKGFWRIRAYVADVLFRIDRQTFGWRGSIRAGADSSFALAHIVRITLFDLAIAVGLTATIWWINQRANNLTPALADSGYIQLTSAIAAMGGVFIGLYYAAITAAMTAVYATMPNAVSHLLLQERFGNAYMRYVATLTFTAIGLLALQSIGVDTKAVGSPSLALGSAVAVFGFVKLGAWAFSLFNPTSVSAAVFRELKGLFKQVVADGYQWRNGPFQRYAQQRCAARVSALAQLADACAQSRHLRNEPLVNLTASMLGIAEFSVTQRPLIPASSLWFPQSYSQPDWYRTTDSQTAIAHHTGTLLQPNTVPNPWWLERELEDAALIAARSLLARRELVHARSIAAALESYVAVLARHGWVKEALESVERFEDAIIPTAIEATVPVDEPLVDRVALLDYIGRMRITSVLRAADWADSLGREQLANAVGGVDWLAPTAPYSLGVAGYAVETAEWLAQRLSFERLVEGGTVTPSWYCSEMLALRDAEAIKRAVDGLCVDAFRRMHASLTTSLERERLWESACFLSDALHYIRKLQVQLERLRLAHERSSAPRRVGFTWPELDFSALDTSLDAEYKWVVERMSELIPRLPPKPKELPDYPGQFLHTATERVFGCVLSGDASALENIFTGTFVGCLAKHNELRVDAPPNDHLLEAQLAVAFAPILDLVELSGYSYLLSEAFPDRRTWPLVARAWDRFLTAHEPFASQLLRIISFSKMGLSIPPRSVLRTNWDQAVGRTLRQLPMRRVDRGFATHEEIDHPNAFVRTAASHRPLGMTYDGADIFAAMYLLARAGIQQELAHRLARDLARRNAAERRTNEADGEDL